MLPSIRYICDSIPVIAVARDLGLAVVGRNRVRCWRTENHKCGDRTASMSIWHNKIHCLVCDDRAYSNLDLVQKFLGLPEGPERSPEQREGTRLAAEWIAQRFEVPSVAAEMQEERPYRPGLDIMEDLIGSALLSDTTPAPRCVVFTLIALCKRGPKPLSYEVLKQLAGVKSDHVVVAGIAAAESIGLLSVQRGEGDGLSRDENVYTLTAESDAYQNALAAAMEKRRRMGEQLREARKERTAARRAERAATKAGAVASPMFPPSPEELEVPFSPESDTPEPPRRYLGTTLCSESSDEQSFAAVGAATFLVDAGNQGVSGALKNNTARIVLQQFCQSRGIDHYVTLDDTALLLNLAREVGGVEVLPTILAQLDTRRIATARDVIMAAMMARTRR